jgi:uncharacterized protein YfaS (alpha-2-macroglobulin family)
MSIKKIVALVLVCCATIALGFGLINKLKSKNVIFLKKYDNYEKLWKRVDSCEKKGLTESALKIVSEIYTRAKAEDNAPQFVKSIIYKLKYAQYKEEFSQEKNINDLTKEVVSAKFPIKSILQSILADSYWQYYQQNRWKFYNRSQTVLINNEDIATWDLKAIINACIYNYKESLKSADSLKATKLDLFDDIIIKGNSETRKWRPTLYNFLAHRALDFFINSEADVTKAAQQFAVNNDAYLKPYPEFLKLQISKPQDSLELKYYALTILQDLYAFNLKTENFNGVLDLELERLNFINSYSKSELKDSLYLQTLSWLQKEFASNPRIAEIKCKEAEWHLQKSSLYQPLNSNDYKDHKTKAHTICNNIINQHPKTLGAQMAQNMLINIEAKSLQIHSEQINDLNLPNRVLVNYTNVTKLYFKLVKTDYFTFRNYQSKLYGEKLLTKLLTLPEVLSFEQNLPSDKDFNSHSVEVKVPPAAIGYYMLLASTNPNFSQNENTITYQNYVVSNLATLNKRKSSGDYDFYVLNRTTGKPLANATIQVWHNKYNYKISEYEFKKGNQFITDANGYATIKGNTSNDENNFFVEVKSGNDNLISNDNFYSYNDYNSIQPQLQTSIFTDRAIYRPGQTIYFKAIVLKISKNNKAEILPNHSTSIEFYDVNNQKISTQTLTTNDYGTVSGSFVAPQGGLTGQMRITDGYGTANISVEEYKRPKFETYFDTLKGSYKLNDDVTVKVIAKAYAGNLLDGAEVNYRVVRTANYPYWWYWYRPFYKQSTEVELTNGTAKTNEKGEYEIKFTALPDPTIAKKDNPIYTYQLFADVTDINGETQSTQTYFKVGYQAIELSVSIPEIVNTQDLPKISITTQNLNGIEEFAVGQLTVYKLAQPDRLFRRRLWSQPDKHLYSKEEYYKLFPNDLFADEDNKYKWEKGKIAFTKNFDTKKDKNIIYNEFKNLPQGAYIIEGLCKDKFGAEVKSINYITIYNPTSSEVPIKSAIWGLPLKTTCEPLETAKFIIASSYNDVNLIYEVESELGVETKLTSPSLKPFEIPIIEANRGGLIANAYFVKFGRVYNYQQFIAVPFSNKELDIQYSTFRNKLLPGQQEEWKLTIKNKKGDKVAAEMLAAMYDASLDAFRTNNWSFNIYNSYYSKYYWGNSLENQNSSQVLNFYTSNLLPIDAVQYDYLNTFGLSYYANGGSRYRYKQESLSSMSERESVAMSAPMQEKAMDKNFRTATKKANGYLNDVSTAATDQVNQTLANAGKDNRNAPSNNLSEVKIRKNFNETAFFFPQLQTNENSEVLIKFTIPESLTKWKFMGFAHTKNLSYAQTQNEVVTQKELMVQPNPPRFFRENDKLTFISKVVNLSDKELNGNIELKLYDALTEQEISTKMLEAASSNSTIGVQNFKIAKGQSTAIAWNLIIPEGYQVIKYKLVAKAGNYSDGEEMPIPVLTNRMLVTESMPLPIRSNQTKEFTFSKFMNQNNNSTTLKNYAYTLEFTANPAWYAVQSLPYLMEYPYECNEQTFARYYSNALASHIANSKPKIKQIFETWKMNSPETFLSNLEKNQELKALVLEETPWVLQSKNETENKKRVGLLFDLNKMSNELNVAFIKLQKAQTINGAWPWFNGCPEDWYITQYIATGFAHLQKIGAIDFNKDYKLKSLVEKAVLFCDSKLQQDYENTKRYDKDYLNHNHLGYTQIQYLYMRSYFKDLKIAPKNNESVEYYKNQSQKYWLNNSRYLQGMIALYMNRYNDKKTATDIMKSLKENALNNEEMGMYWKENNGGYYWYQAPVEMQALMIEAFDEVSADLKSVDDLKTWLIKNKQTQHWGTTRATTEAVYALLLQGTDWLSTEPTIEISLGDLKIDPKTDKDLKVEAGTGYFKKTFTGNDIKPSMATIKVTKKDVGVSWGSVYWQYFEQLNKITPHETPLKLSKKLFLESMSASGPVIAPISANNVLKLGDKIKVRIELKVDRDMQYVHLKDMRASGFEPTNVFSGYRYQDGLGYYEATKDASTNFFISYLPKGTYVFEYPLVVSHSGTFSNGISTIQCMYAPEFTSHSEGITVSVIPK